MSDGAATISITLPGDSEEIKKSMENVVEWDSAYTFQGEELHVKAGEATAIFDGKFEISSSALGKFHKIAKKIVVSPDAELEISGGKLVLSARNVKTGKDAEVILGTGTFKDIKPVVVMGLIPLIEDFPKGKVTFYCRTTSKGFLVMWWHVVTETQEFDFCSQEKVAQTRPEKIHVVQIDPTDFGGTPRELQDHINDIAKQLAKILRPDVVIVSTVCIADITSYGVA